MHHGSCPQELGRLLLEERLAGATLLIMANKQDVPGALGADDIRQVRSRSQEPGAAPGAQTAGSASGFLVRGSREFVTLAALRPVSRFCVGQQHT